MKGKVDAEKRDRLLSKLYERAIIYGKDLACQIEASGLDEEERKQLIYKLALYFAESVLEKEDEWDECVTKMILRGLRDGLIQVIDEEYPEM